MLWELSQPFSSNQMNFIRNIWRSGWRLEDVARNSIGRRKNCADVIARGPAHLLRQRNQNRPGNSERRITATRAGKKSEEKGSGEHFIAGGHVFTPCWVHTCTLSGTHALCASRQNENLPPQCCRSGWIPKMPLRTGWSKELVCRKWNARQLFIDWWAPAGKIDVHFCGRMKTTISRALNLSSVLNRFSKKTSKFGADRLNKSKWASQCSKCPTFQLLISSGQLVSKQLKEATSPDLSIQSTGHWLHVSETWFTFNIWARSTFHFQHLKIPLPARRLH